MTGLLPSYADAASLAGRVLLGVLMLNHGWPKIKDLKGTVAFVKGTGWPGGEAFAILFSLLEFFGAIALIVGFLTQIVAGLFVLEMVATTIFSQTKLKKKLSGGYELDIAYATLALVILLLGPGAWSLDHVLGLA
jgi:putative oxidoreductase